MKINQDKIKNFCNNYKYINSLIFSLNKPNHIIQVFYKTEDEYREVIEKIKDLLILLIIQGGFIRLYTRLYTI